MVKEITTKVSKSHKERIMVSYTSTERDYHLTVCWVIIIFYRYCYCYCCCWLWLVPMKFICGHQNQIFPTAG